MYSSKTRERLRKPNPEPQALSNKLLDFMKAVVTME